MLQNDVIKSCLIATSQQRGEIVSRRHFYTTAIKGREMWELLLDDNGEASIHRITMTWESVTWVN